YAEEGDYAVTVTVSDVGSQLVTGTVLHVADAPLGWIAGGPTFTWSQAQHPAPQVLSPGSQTGAEGDAVSLAVAASDPDGDPLAFAAVNLPAGLAIDPATGVISGTVG